jgi:penicillin-binding protein 1A
MAYAYSTLANDGNRVWGTLGPSARSPVAIEKVKDPDGRVRDQNRIRHTRVMPYNIAQSAKGILAQVVQSGTGTAAQIGEFAAGKTGTTENYGDAWFVGFNKELTVAVWVGYADRLKPMLTEFHGQAVAGGTFPAEIWHDFMTAWIKIRDARKAARDVKNGVTPTTTTTTPSTTTSTTTTTTPAQTTPQTTKQAPAQTPAATPKKTKTPTQTAPADPAPTSPPAQTTPAPTQAPPSDGGGGAGTGPATTAPAPTGQGATPQTNSSG